MSSPPTSLNTLIFNLKISVPLMTFEQKTAFGMDCCEIIENTSLDNFDDFYNLCLNLYAKNVLDDYPHDFKLSLLAFQNSPLVQLMKIIQTNEIQLDELKTKFKKLYDFPALQAICGKLGTKILNDAEENWDKIVSKKFDHEYYQLIDLLLERLHAISSDVEITNETFYTILLDAPELEHFKGFLEYKYVVNYFQAFIRLHDWGWLSDEYNVEFLKQRSREYMGTYLDCLQQLIESTPEDLSLHLAIGNVNILLNQEEVINCGLEIIEYLIEFNLMDDTHQGYLHNFEGFEAINNLLRGLYELDILRQETAQDVFKTIFDNDHILFEYAEFNQLWESLSYKKAFTMEIWLSIKEICDSSINELFKAKSIGNLLFQNGLLDKPFHIQINVEESTHHTSIHKTSSESAIRLELAYKDKLSPSVYKELYEWLMSPENHKIPYIRSIRKALQYILENDYVDPDSSINLKDLLGLVWIAIHDDTRRLSSLDDCLKALLNAFYDVKRGNNMDINFVDEGGADQQICLPGVFNKLIESFVSLHPDFEQLLITLEVLTLKLPRVTLEKFKNYLTMMLRVDDEKNFSYIHKLFFYIYREGFELIWPSLKEKIADELYDEFQVLFLGRHSVSFCQIIENGFYTDTTEVDMQQEFSQSLMYNRHQYRMLFQNHKLQSETEKLALVLRPN